MTGTKHLALEAIAVGVPFALLLLMAVILGLVLPGEAGPPGGGGGPPGPTDGPPDEPPWWPAFEKAFHQHVGQSSGEPADAGPAPGSEDRREPVTSLPAPVPRVPPQSPQGGPCPCPHRT
ncbi:MAG: hypothetical protein LBI49_04865 [Nocardiopsaceae bacterium]|nr:hypothetical protein [Nocardiopsaceae bacterium]